MSAALANEVIHVAHVLVTASARGSQGGQCAAKAVYDDTVAAAEVLGWPIDVDKVGWQTSVPNGGWSSRPKAKAGTLPIAAKCQLEFLANGGIPDAIVGTTRRTCLFTVRSLLVAMLDQGVRIAEGLRVDLQIDEEDPLDVMRFTAYLAKDGEPFEVFAPVEGFTGEYASSAGAPGGLSTCVRCPSSGRSSLSGSALAARRARSRRRASSFRTSRSPSTSARR